MKNIRFLQNISNKNLRKSILLSLSRPIASHNKISYGQTSCNETSGQDVKTGKVVNEEDILIKYRNIINKMTSISESSDIYHKTNFGSIMFDDENLPMEYYKDSRYRPISKSSDKAVETSSITNPNFIDEYYFESALENCDNLTTTTAHSDKPKRSSVIKNHEDNLDLNYVDSQYLSNYSENNIHEQVQNASAEDVDDSDMNLVDKLYFTNNSKSDTMILSNYENLCDENLNGSILKSQLSLERDNFANSSLHSFAQAIDEDFELPLPDSNSTCNTKQLNNRTQLEADLLALSESLSTNKAKQYNLKLQQLNESSASQPSSTIRQDKIEKTVPLSNVYDNKEEVAKTVDATSPSIQNAFEYVIKKRREDKKNQQGENNEVTNKCVKIMNEVPIYKGLLKHDFVHLLRRSILYNDNDIIAISKPYGVTIHGGDKDKYGKRSAFTIVDSLPDLAKLLKIEKIIPVHRLDVNTTGVLLLAKSCTMADYLKKIFVDQKIKKSYLAITKGIPSPVSGVIKIPIAEGKVENHVRMVLRPDIPGFRGKSGKSRQAITHFKVLSRANNSALVMLNPISGIKHQLRVHLGFGLACPVLGDHKYSHLKKMVPQKLPGDMLDHLQVKQTRVRDLPMYLHAFSVTIPDILGAKDLFVRVGPPKFFKTTMRCLELNKSKNHINEVPELIFDTEY